MVCGLGLRSYRVVGLGFMVYTLGLLGVRLQAIRLNS